MNPKSQEALDFLSTPIDKILAAPTVPFGFDGAELSIVPKKLNYIVEPHRITLSFSKLQTLRNCPRMFQCKELLSGGEYKPSIDTAYGHAWAQGVQALFCGHSLAKASFLALEAWDFPYWTDPWGKKADKSIWACLASLEMWHDTQFPRLWEQYKIATLANKDAVELFVYLAVGEGYSYQVHIDLVLEDRHTGGMVVAELKTSGMIQQQANWANSIQTLGYYTQLATIARMEGRAVDPEILYIVQQTGKLHKPEENWGFHTFPFAKDGTAPAEFMQDLAIQCSNLETYIGAGYFPKYGHHCVQFGKPCQYFGTCDTLPARKASKAVGANAQLAASGHYDIQDLTSADYVLDFEQIVNILGGSEEDHDNIIIQS